MTEEKKSKGLNGENSLNSTKRGGRIMNTDEKEQKRISRREFVKGAAVGAAGVAAAGALASCTTPTPEVITKEVVVEKEVPVTVEVEKQVIVEKEVPVEVIKEVEVKPWLPKKWDYEADVVVVGWGGAGASTAITASDAGAKVILLEKAPEGEEGGNTRVSANLWFNPTNVADAITYLNAMSDGYPVPQDLVQVWAEKMCDNDNWFESIGGEVEKWVTGAEYPDLPGASSWDGFSIGARPEGVILGNEMTWKIMRAATVERDIEIMYETPGVELVQDLETKEILGIMADKAGKKVYIKAKKAVVLTCGGFENNQEMVRDYLHLPYCYPKGTPYNTGDGIKMALKINADLWHMGNLAGPDFNFKAPELPTAFGYTFGSASKGILVGADGTRYVNETASRKHGKIAFHGIFVPDFMPLPIHFICDETTRLAGPFYMGGFLAGWTWADLVSGYKWSADNSVEIEKGWITKADTLGELATKIGKEGIVDAVDRWNGLCAAGADTDFGRSESSLVPIAAPPFYAIELSPSFTNTQGGPRHNKHAQILDTEGNVIPRLYSAGECGSIYSHCYQGGGNVGETMAFGRIAGENAAALEPWA